MALPDADRFEGRFRDGVHVADPSDLIRRLIKEQLLKFDGTPLFPERWAYTVNYRLSDLEAQLYREVTEYVRDGMLLRRAESHWRELAYRCAQRPLARLWDRGILAEGRPLNSRPE
jgi:hypothetical protein